jgi:hypothetical protein
MEDLPPDHSANVKNMNTLRIVDYLY